MDQWQMQLQHNFNQLQTFYQLDLSWPPLAMKLNLQLPFLASGNWELWIKIAVIPEQLTVNTFVKLLDLQQKVDP